jgi:predicted phosphodiesterase
MKIAIIADLHGNLIAFEAVLADIERDDVAQIVCLGDVCGLGARPREALHRLRALACPVVMGNADEFMLDPSLLDPARHPRADTRLRRLHDMERWAVAQLSPEDRDYIATFQPTVQIDLDEGRSLLCYHGSPRSSREEIRASTSEAELAVKLGERRALVMAGGHTHEQFLRCLDQSIVINPGSVGLPWETQSGGTGRNPPWAEYAVLALQGQRLSVDLRRVPVDQEAIRRSLLDSGMPHAVRWAADWR